MTSLQRRGLVQAKECCDSARSAIYSHNWPKDVQEFIKDPKHAHFGARLGEALKQVESHISQAENWIGAVIESDIRNV